MYVRTIDFKITFWGPENKIQEVVTCCVAEKF